MKARLHRVIWWLPLAALLACAAAKAQEVSRHAAFLRFVNQVALPHHMIVGERSDPDGPCRLRLDAASIQGADAPSLRRIYAELVRSGVRSDINRFNAPRSIADAELFAVDDETCQPTDYRGSETAFQRPGPRPSHPFTLEYRGQPASGATLTVTRRGKIARFTSVYSPKTEVDLAAPGAKAGLGDLVVLKWNGEVLGNWDRKGWSILRDMKKLPRVFITIADPATGAVLHELGENGRVNFTPGTVLSVHESGPGGVRRHVATVHWKPSEASRPLYRQDRNGAASWSRQPTSYEAEVVRALQAEGSRVKRRVVLSADPAFNAVLDDYLERAGNEVESSAAFARRDRRLYGSIAVIDGLNGEVLGHASYPPREPGLPVGRGAFLPSSGREEFLTRRVIGSVAKVPVSLAIVAAHPDLLSLRMERGTWQAGVAKYNTLLGKVVVPPFEDHSARGCAELVDFTCFMVKSLNRYAATLIAVAASQPEALASPQAQGGPPLGPDVFHVKVGGQEVKVQRQPGAFLFASTPSGQSLRELPWAGQLEALFDVDTAADTAGSHGYMWARAVTGGRDGLGVHALDAVSPERENMRLNLATDLRRDYYQIILGANESRWSSVKVAEAFARITSGTRLQAGFVAIPEGGAVAWPPLIDEKQPRAAEAHAKLLDALAKVVPDGTGSYAKPQVNALKAVAASRKLTLKVYAKTGTPTVDDYRESDRTHAIRAAVAARLVEFRARTDDARDGWKLFYRGQAIDAELVRRLPDEMEATFGKPGMQKSAVRYLAMVNGQEGDDQERYCAFRGQSLECREIEVRRTGDDKGRNLAMVLVLSDAQGTPCRSISIAWGMSARADKSDAAFRRMVRGMLGTRGPIATALGLAGPPKGCAA